MKTLILASLLALVACKDKNPSPNVPDATHHSDAAVDAAPDAPVSCVDPLTGCFKTDLCAPVQLEDFLNACTDVPCQQFDNVARLPNYNNGNLPPLP